MPRAGQQQFIELAQRVRPDGVDDVVADKGLDAPLVGRDVEVVEPELGHARQQRLLDVGAAAAHQAPGGGVARHACAVALGGFGGQDSGCGIGLGGGALAALFAFVAVALEDLGQRGVEIRRHAAQPHRLCAGGARGVDLSQRPRACAAGALHLLDQGRRRPVTQARQGAIGRCRFGGRVVGARGNGAARGQRGQQQRHGTAARGGWKEGLRHGVDPLRFARGRHDECAAAPRHTPPCAKRLYKLYRGDIGAAGAFLAVLLLGAAAALRAGGGAASPWRRACRSARRRSATVRSSCCVR